MAYLLRRLLSLLPVVFGVMALTFLLIHMIPGDPIDIMLGDYATDADRAALSRELGLDKPLLSQFKDYVLNLTRLDLGRSLQTQRPVLREILNRLPATLKLGGVALVIALCVGLPLGVLASIYKRSWLDRMTLGGGVLALSLPSFWTGPLLIWFFSLELGWFPLGEADEPLSIVLPAITLSVGVTALIIRMTRTSMLEVLREDYIRVARAKGLSFFKIYFVHALTNAMIPILTLVGIMLGALLTGAVIIETIFDWPGLGLLIYQGIQNRDYPLVQGCVLFVSMIYLLANFLTDLAYAYFNPKMRME
ncbi:MAG: ABC transporter permease [Bdellovibrionales bacterium]|nr:ABC transporter permease [Bdellovibrionales bacterium]